MSGLGLFKVRNGVSVKYFGQVCIRAKKYFRAYKCLTVVYNVVGNGDEWRQGARCAAHINNRGLRLMIIVMSYIYV